MEGDDPLMFQVIAHTSPLPSSSHEESLVEIVMRVQRGDPEAFTHLYQMYHVSICTYLTRMVGSAEQGEDLAQETFIKAWHSLPSAGEDLHFKAWFYRIATNTAIDYLRSQRLRIFFGKQESDALDNLGAEGPGFEEQLAETEYIQLALKGLSPKYRACLLLQTLGGFSQREIATLLTMSEKNVSVYVRRGREQFKKEYEHMEKGHVQIQRRSVR